MPALTIESGVALHCSDCGSTNLTVRSVPAAGEPHVHQGTRSESQGSREPYDHELWLAQANAALRSLAATGAVFQAYDLVLMRGLPEPPDPCFWGVLMRLASGSGLIVCAGRAESRRPGGGIVYLWRTRDWL